MESSSANVYQGVGYIFTIRSEARTLKNICLHFLQSNRINFQTRLRIKDCEPDPNLWPMSKCLSAFTSRVYPNLTCGEEELNNQDDWWAAKDCAPELKFLVICFSNRLLKEICLME